MYCPNVIGTSHFSSFKIRSVIYWANSKSKSTEGTNHVYKQFCNVMKIKNFNDKGPILILKI